MKLLLLVFFCVFGFSSAALPPYLKVCRRSDPDITNCIINSVLSLKPQLNKGIPELKVPTLEPLPLEKIMLKSGPSTAKIDANITNLLVYGASSFEVLQLKVDLEKNRFLFTVRVPHVYFKGDYDMDMNVLIIKYKGQGDLTGNFTDLIADVLMKGRIVKLNGENHLKFKKFGINMRIGHSYFHLGNLFGNQEALARATNEVVNENSDLFLDEIKPVLESSLAEKFTEVSNSICESFTYEELFPK